MKPKERAAMQQALEALNKIDFYSDGSIRFYPYEDDVDAAITALREALAEQVTEWETPWKYNPHTGKRLVVGEVAMAEQAEQEPVAWANADQLDNLLGDRTATIEGNRSMFRATPLYAAPVRTKDLTDDEIKQASLLAGLQNHYMGFHSSFLRFARAVIAADREKNK